MSSLSVDSVLVESESDKKPRFAGMVQVYTDKTATTVKAFATVTYPVRVTLLNFTNELRRYLSDNGHTFAGLLLVSTAAQLD